MAKGAPKLCIHISEMVKNFIFTGVVQTGQNGFLPPPKDQPQRKVSPSCMKLDKKKMYHTYVVIIGFLNTWCQTLSLRTLM